MGLAGKHPKSNEYKAINGLRLDRLGNQTPIDSMPVKPSKFSVIQAKFWDSTIAELIRLNAVTGLDQAALEQLCHWYEVFVSTAAALKDADFSTTGSARLLNANMRAADSFRRLAIHFGLTPLSRNSVSFDGPDAEESGPFK